MIDVAELENRAAEAGIPLQHILRRAGVHRATIWRWKNGKAEPRPYTRGRLENALNELCPLPIGAAQ